MKRLLPISMPFALLLTALAAPASSAAPVARAQDEGGEGQPGGDPQREVMELFRSVETDLEEIDRLLLEAASEPRGGGAEPDAAKGGKAAPEDRSAARDANGKQRKVIESIQKILELIPKSGSSSGGSGQRPQGSPPPSGTGENEPKGSKPGDREKTPQGAQKAPTPSGGADQPKDPRKSNADPSQGKRPPSKHPTERNPNAGGAVDRWGDLPEYARDTFRNDRTDDVPLRYRRWIEDFYRRVQKAESDGGR